MCRANEVLADEDLAAWLTEIEQACQLTASDGTARTVGRRENEAEIFAGGQRPEGRIFSGPSVNGEVWRRAAARIAEKAQQTTGGPAWLRLDDTGTLFHLTDRSAQPMQGLLADLQLNVAAALAAAPHVRGIVLSSGVMVNPGNARDETAWGASRSANADRTRASSPYTR